MGSNVHHAPPMFNFYSFLGVRNILLNDTMCDILSSALFRSEIEHPVLEAICKDLVGKTVTEEFDDSNDSIPSYGYNYFRNIGNLMLNSSAAKLLADAIEESSGGRQINESLWSLYHKIMGEWAWSQILRENPSRKEELFHLMWEEKEVMIKQYLDNYFATRNTAA